MSWPGPRGAVGRPVATSHADIEQVAFRLFAERGFEATTLDDIARGVGVARRTLFRYFASKNDIPWGQFDRTLSGFRELLDSTPRSLPVVAAVEAGVVAFNRLPSTATPSHRDRMRLILQTPALQAHSVLRYAEWRRVVAEFVADRLGGDPGRGVPHLVGHVALGIALAAYEVWLVEEGAELAPILAEHFERLREFVSGVAPVTDLSIIYRR